MKTLILTIVLLSVFFSPRVQCVQRQQNDQAPEPIGENSAGEKAGPNAGRRSVVDKIQAKAKDILDAMPAKAMEMLGPLPDQTREMMGKALDQSKVVMDKTVDIMHPYIQKMDDMQPGVADMVQNIKKRAAETVDNVKKMIRKDKDELCHGKSLPSNASLMVGKRVLQGEAWSDLSDSRGTHDLGDKLGDHFGDKFGDLGDK
ncbi:hypothetical protein AVEN_100864-2 [Araneus ventricosus]|uniref:Uncharacterized protein n=1 Tax=Araneus ventricosus TaxID=182803 RepID=A0A4Y2AYQ8_ARAVE|nr:hypothetical protein AVEN_100864-2 [Araneus ventricosus]